MTRWKNKTLNEIQAREIDPATDNLFSVFLTEFCEGGVDNLPCESLCLHYLVLEPSEIRPTLNFVSAYAQHLR
jgi:hypothetical protein